MISQLSKVKLIYTKEKEKKFEPSVIFNQLCWQKKMTISNLNYKKLILGLPCFLKSFFIYHNFSSVFIWIILLDS